MVYLISKMFFLKFIILKQKGMGKLKSIFLIIKIVKNKKKKCN